MKKHKFSERILCKRTMFAFEEITAVQNEVLYEGFSIFSTDFKGNRNKNII